MCEDRKTLNACLLRTNTIVHSSSCARARQTPGRLYGRSRKLSSCALQPLLAAAENYLAASAVEESSS